MHSDWETAKDDYIARYFADNQIMQEIAKLAFNGNPCKQEELAEWFFQNGMAEEAERWLKKAQSLRENQ